MTVTEAKALAESYVDDVIEEVDALMWMNECLHQQYADDAEIYGTAVITATDTATYHTLPTDFVDMVAITNADGSDYYGGYYIIGEGIRFSVAGILTLTYRRLPALVTSMTSTIDLHPLLTQTTALWLALRYKQKDDDENPDSSRLRFEFDKQKRAQLAVIRRKSNPSVIPMAYGM